jgi:hypothetical protein
MSFLREPIHIDTWPQIHALLAPALALTGEGVSSLIDLLLTGQNQLWVLREGGDPIAAAVAEDEGGVLCIRLMGGKDMIRWIGDAVNTIRLQAQEKQVRVEVVPGLERVLRERGFRKSKVVMELAQ